MKTFLMAMMLTMALMCLAIITIIARDYRNRLHKSHLPFTSLITSEEAIYLVVSLIGFFASSGFFYIIYMSN